VGKLRFVDLFAGIGGFRIAFEKADYECVYSCEIDPNCQDVYFNNFGEKPESDINKIDINSLPDFDVLTAGFPCQPFSICGKRKGFYDTRGTLFFRVCEIIEAKNPPVIVLENVKHLIHQDKGRTLDVILYSLEDLGYKVNYQLLNSKEFGVPQNRERIIIVGTKTKPFNFQRLRKVLPTPKLKNFLSKSDNFEYLDAQSYTLIDEPKQQQSGLIFVGYRNNKTIWKKGVRPNTHHLSRVHHQPNRIYSVEGVHPTIPSQETSGRFFIYLPDEDTVRKLTVKECYRIMGFPDDFKIHNSLSECYKQVGNSVCIPMVYEIANQLKEQIFFNHDDWEKTSDIVSENQEEFVQLEIPGLCVMNHKEKLLQVYEASTDINDIQRDIPENYQKFIAEIAKNCSRLKGVYTVLVTLLVHKTINPNQDIRLHQAKMRGGFSGRTVDTQYITPTLRELGLPAMAESGWLTRSLEQPYPYNLDYSGDIGSKSVKEAFLNLIDFAQNNPGKAESVLRVLLNKIIQNTKSSQVKIERIL